jgi:membrane protease YdiL (CAAX protease family)
VTVVAAAAVFLAAPPLQPDQVIAAGPQIDQPAEESAATELLPAASQPEAANSIVPRAVVLALAAAALAIFFGRGWHRLPPERATSQRVALDPSLAIGLFVAMSLLRVAGGAITFRLLGLKIPLDGSTESVGFQQIVMLTAGTYAAEAIGLSAVFVAWHRAKRRVSEGGPPRANLFKAMLIGTGALVLAWPVVQAAAMLVTALSGGPDAEIAHETLRRFVDYPIDGWWLALAAMVIFIAPIMEEVMYRGLLQRAMVHFALGRWCSILVTSAIFSCMHIGIVAPQALAALFVLSLGLGWVYERTGRLTAPIVMHVLFNAANLALATVSAQ